MTLSVWADQPAAWPTGLVARYLTRAGEALRDPSITVDVYGGGRYRKNNTYLCRACGTESLNSEGTHLDWAMEHAQFHAEKCRALPRPAGA